MTPRRRRYGTRLTRKESQRMLRQGMTFFVLAVVLVLALIFYGVPAMVKLASFFGEIKNSSQPIQDQDSIAPFAPVITVPYEATFSAQIVVSGYAEPNSTVTLYNNQQKVSETLAGQEGEFTFSSVSLEVGNNQFKALAQDDQGNQSTYSRTEVVIFDTTAPELTITAPGPSGSTNSSLSQTITISGTTETGSRVFVKDRLARVDSEGHFSVNISLAEGDNSVTVTATDPSGNSTSQSLTVTY
jgi:hypothetical protein